MADVPPQVVALSCDHSQDDGAAGVAAARLDPLRLVGLPFDEVEISGRARSEENVIV